MKFKNIIIALTITACSSTQVATKPVEDTETVIPYLNPQNFCKSLVREACIRVEKCSKTAFETCVTRLNAGLGGCDKVTERLMCPSGVYDGTLVYDCLDKVSVVSCESFRLGDAVPKECNKDYYCEEELR